MLGGSETSNLPIFYRIQKSAAGHRTSVLPDQMGLDSRHSHVNVLINSVSHSKYHYAGHGVPNTLDNIVRTRGDVRSTVGHS